MPMNPNTRVLSTLIGALMTTVAPVSLASAQTIGSVTAAHPITDGVTSYHYVTESTYATGADAQTCL